LRRLAAAGSFNSVLSPDRSNAQPDQSFSALYANRLEQVKACERQVTAARGNSPKLVYAGFGHDDKGRNVSALGFVYSAKKGSPADHYAFWVWRVGKCSSTPELYVSGMLKR
jgi:hypothetical protein